MFYNTELFRQMVNIRMDGWVPVRMGVRVYVCDVCVVGLASFLLYDKRVGPTVEGEERPKDKELTHCT